jgi:branched-chain amino acid transport system ATP-binding protein
MIIEAKDIHHRYSGVIALGGVSMRIAQGSFTAILGPNGAGKSTCAQILGGLLRPSSGEVEYHQLREKPGRSSMVAAGICLVPEGRRLFGQLTIEENLIVAGYGVGLNQKQIRDRIETVIDILPPTIRNLTGSRLAASLSGGERQMLALSRALMSDPTVIILDEPSLGLAPIMVERVYEVLQDLRARGVTVVVVEQLATQAVRNADTLYLLSRGCVAFTGPATGQAAAEAIKASYVGHAEQSNSGRIQS